MLRGHPDNQLAEVASLQSVELGLQLALDLVNLICVRNFDGITVPQTLLLRADQLIE